MHGGAHIRVPNMDCELATYAKVLLPLQITQSPIMMRLLAVVAVVVVIAGGHVAPHGQVQTHYHIGFSAYTHVTSIAESRA